MVFNTFTVASAVTPSVIETYFSHYFNRGPLKQKPTAHISYHEGLRLIRQFLDYSSKHSIEDLQSFTAQWVPAPTWIRTQDVEVPPQFLKRSANVLRAQLGSNGLEQVGGDKWWQWRRQESPLHAEWIEMKKDYNERRRLGVKCDRCILYVHGGAYYFGSVDEHRYQMQRHARKLKARVLSPRYRLAPQFPFPCGLYDCIATYFYLLEHFKPSEILFAGDSAGGGMVVSMLVTLRDQGCPLPAGVLLLSPWVDLTHSFPSTSGDGAFDYIPPHGFHHKPSLAWPPPAQTEVKAQKLERKFTQPVEQPFDVVELPATMDMSGINLKPSSDNLRAEAQEHARNPPPANLNQLPGFGHKLELEIDGKLIRIQEQIQLYAKNELLTHPLVSPVQQPSLGGLPPMLIQVGGGELLRDEQIYLAHKAANPKAYPPSAAVLNEYDPERVLLNRYPPTDVQLQVWEDLCHVPHTLSFTRPAKYMYRSVAQFGAWALARAQNKSIEILDDDAVSIISDGDEDEKEEEAVDGDKSGVERKSQYGSIGIEGVSSNQVKLTANGAVGRAGEELPPFKEHMIRQRVNRHGQIFPLAHKSQIECLHLDPSTIGTIKPGPVRKWLAKRAENEQKFASEYKKLIKKRAKEGKDGYDPPEDGEYPPPTALYNRRRRGAAPEEKKRGKSWGLAMWSGWGSSHDEDTIQREEKIVSARAEEEAAAASAAERSDSIATTAIAKDDESTPRKAKKDAAGVSGLTVPGRESEADIKAKRRRSSASILPSPWSKREDSRPRTSSYRQVKDIGQADSEGKSAVSPIADLESPQTPWKENRRPSVASGKQQSVSRPVSMAGPDSSSLPPFAPVPTTSEIANGQDAVKVLGTENTFLNPDNSRPHNGIVAYPFKLRQTDVSGSPNLSTLTLESHDPSEKESTGFNSHASNAATGQVDSGAVEKASVVQGPETAMDAEHGSTPDNARQIVSQGSAGQPQDLLAEHSRTLNADNASLERHTGTENDLVSSLEHTTPTAATAASSDSAQPQQNRFESRDSRLGFLGADGMPTSAWGSQENSMATENGGSQMPFKIRNPVYDPRAGTSQAPEASIPEQQTDATKGAPFRLRHTIYEPKVAPVNVRPSTENLAVEGAQEGAAGGEVREPSGTEVMLSDDTPALPPFPPHIQDAPNPGSNQRNRSQTNESSRFATSKADILPSTAYTSRPIMQRIDSEGLPPPPPPPKDDVHIVTGRTPSSSVSDGSGMRRKPFVPSRKNTSVSTTSDAPPTIGDLSFETGSPISPLDRPTLETFVTASAGLDLKSLQSNGGRF